MARFVFTPSSSNSFYDNDEVVAITKEEFFTKKLNKQKNLPSNMNSSHQHKQYAAAENSDKDCDGKFRALTCKICKEKLRTAQAIVIHAYAHKQELKTVEKIMEKRSLGSPAVNIAGLQALHHHPRDAVGARIVVAESSRAARERFVEADDCGLDLTLKL